MTFEEFMDALTKKKNDKLAEALWETIMRGSEEAEARGEEEK